MKKHTTLDMIKTGQNLKQAIQSSKYTVRELQEILHMECPQPIYRWMKGKALPSVDHLYALSMLFGMHMEEFLVANESKEIEVPVEEEIQAKKCNCIWDWNAGQG